MTALTMRGSPRLRPATHTSRQPCSSVRLVQPREWCYPNDAFGKITDSSGDPIQTRVWRAPAEPETSRDRRVLNQWATFRAAVIQNAYSLHLRSYKNAHKPIVTRQRLGEIDRRPDSERKWTGRLTGTSAWDLDDTAVVLQHFPGALPDWRIVQVFLDVATGVRNPPANWPWPDTAGPAQRLPKPSP